MWYNSFMRKIFFATIFLLIASLSFFTISSSSADEITDLNKKIQEHKNKIKELEDSMDYYKKIIDQKQLETVSLKNQLSILDDKTKRIETDVALTQEKIASAELEIRALEFSINDKATDIERQKAFISSLIKKIHVDGEKNYLEIILTQNNFADFYSEVKNLQDINNDLTRSIKNLRSAKDELDVKKDLISEQKKKYQSLKNDLVDKEQDLTEQVKDRKKLLVETKASESQYQGMLTTLKKQSASIEADIRNYEEMVKKKLEDQNKIKAIDTSISFEWPVSSRYITARFHDPNYPFRNVFEHNAIDIRASYGTPVKAASSGYVGRARRCTLSSCYAYILLVHTGNLSTVYGHLSKILVEDDQYVNKGEVIAYSGGTPGTVGAGPFVTGAHLHFETRLNGIPVDPLGYLVQ
jgi:murein DD-endopeptidase MepM/ murein hydrolase activator NlpD